MATRVKAHTRNGRRVKAHTRKAKGRGARAKQFAKRHGSDIALAGLTAAIYAPQIAYAVQLKRSKVI